MRREVMFFFLVVLVILVLAFSFGGSNSVQEAEQEKYNLPIYSKANKFAPYTLKDGVKEFRLTASHFYWDIGNGTLIEVYGFNNQIPGPTIRTVAGESLRIIVENNITEPTTVHWHGLNIPNDMDGVPFLTQDPIDYGNQFVYEFTPSQTGTFMYHSHFNVPVQGDMGLSGPLIIEDENGTLDYDKEVIMFLDDWSVDSSGHNNALTQKPFERIYNYHTISGKMFPFTQTIDVFEGDLVLIRLINIGNENVPFHFHGPHVKILRMDGNDVSHLGIFRDTIDIAPGQRYDVELNASTSGNWLAHSHTAKQITNNGEYPGGIITVIIFLDGERPSADYGQ